MIKFTYHIVNGELCDEGEVIVDCKKALMHGVIKQRMWDEELECHRDIEAFYIKHNGREYGNIGMTMAEYIGMCQCVGGCVDQICPPDKIYVCVYDDQYI